MTTRAALIAFQMFGMMESAVEEVDQALAAVRPRLAGHASMRSCTGFCASANGVAAETSDLIGGSVGKPSAGAHTTDSELSGAELRQGSQIERP